MFKKELHKLEEKRAKDDYLMWYGPVSICESKLRNITVKIDGILSTSTVEYPQPPLLYDLGDPILFKVFRRPGEGKKPIFANVLVNQLPDFRRAFIRNSRSPELLGASETILSTRRPGSSPAHTSSQRNRDRSRSRHRSISRSRLSLSRSSSSYHRYRSSSPEIELHKNRVVYRPSRSGSVHRRSPKPTEINKHDRLPKRSVSRDSSGRSPSRRSLSKRRDYSSRRSPNRPSRSKSVHRRSPQPPETNKHDRSPKRRRSRDSSGRSPSKRANSSGRRTSPRRYSPNRQYSSSRSSQRPSPSNRRHSDKGLNYSSRRSSDRRSSPRRHHSPSKNEMPVMTVPMDPSYHGFYQMPIPPEYWMGLAHTAAPMFRPRIPSGFIPRPIRSDHLFRPRLLPGFIPRPTRPLRIPGVYISHQQHQQPANKQTDRPAPSSTITLEQQLQRLTKNKQI